jgi:large conductance mechanosensitive channel
VLQDGSPAGPYETLIAAQEAGAVVMSYGVFLNVLMAFFLTALVLFIVIRYVRRMSAFRRQEEVDAPPESIKSCPFCMSKIDMQATRCAFCTAELPVQA